MRFSAALLLILAATSLHAGSNPKTARAARTATPPRIDAHVNEPVWQLAPAITDFSQYEPDEGAVPTQRTEVRFLYDDDALYISATMFDADPSGIVARLARRDDEIESDFISFRIDSYHDFQTAYEFTVNAAGVKVDILQYDDGAREDVSWDAVWEVATRIGDHGWTAELRIPLTMLRFHDADEQVWGLQIVRGITRNKERDYWALIRRSESGWVSKFGVLRGIEGVKSRASLEVLPFGLVENTALTERPGRAGVHHTAFNAGVDIKYRPTGGLTIDATFNPDFGQVEADPAVLNLSTFETFYPEKRPFFVEGVQILRFTTFGDGFGPGLFYSRRIGQPLSASPPSNGYVEDEPRFATILGAAKVSGKTSSGLSIGVLEAVTAEESATVVDSNGRRRDVRVAPMTNYSLVRLRQDFSGNSNVGMILTSVNREDRIPALTGGVDWNLRFLDNMYRVDGFVAHNRTAARGFVEEGQAGRVGLSKDGGPNWRGSVSADFTSRRYNINDIGFFRRPNDHGVVGTITYRDDEAREWTRRWNVSLNHHKRWNYERAEINNSLSLTGYQQFMNYWDVSAGVTYDAGDFDDRETRGHGLYAKPSMRQVSLSIDSDSRAAIVGEMNLEYAADSRRGRGMEIGVELLLKPSDALTIEMEVQHELVDREFAWMTNRSDTLVMPGSFAVFADRTTRAWDATARGSFVFSRDLTLQWYLQWFAAKGRYEDAQARLGVDAYRPYSQPVREFNDLSFHSNLVLRWEYRPGSTLFLVWSHSRSGDGGPFGNGLLRDADDTFRLAPDNVLLMKLSYWLST
ncbi:MAG: carbohydrate binding family 9 domain-containing protein [Bacteroidetes bacterium]|nr:carbohydrate binding family 9 domain-containing protein [Bacteroidota bacterium]